MTTQQPFTVPDDTQFLTHDCLDPNAPKPFHYIVVSFTVCDHRMHVARELTSRRDDMRFCRRCDQGMLQSYVANNQACPNCAVTPMRYEFLRDENGAYVIHVDQETRRDGLSTMEAVKGTVYRVQDRKALALAPAFIARQRSNDPPPAIATNQGQHSASASQQPAASPSGGLRWSEMTPIDGTPGQASIAEMYESTGRNILESPFEQDGVLGGGRQWLLQRLTWR